MIRVRVAIGLHIGDAPCSSAAAHGPLEWIVRPAGAESMGHLPHLCAGCRVACGAQPWITLTW